MKEMQEKAEEKKEQTLPWMDEKKLATIILTNSQSNIFEQKKNITLTIFVKKHFTDHMIYEHNYVAFPVKILNMLHGQ